MRRVLITGGAGFIGSHLAERLLAKGCEVVVLDDLSSGRRSHIQELGDRIRFIEGDVRDLAVHSPQIGAVDTVYHLAALISGYDSLHDAEAYFDTNVRGTLEVLRFCRGLDDRPRLVFASSSTVYGQDSERPLRSEADIPSPLTVYALSKLAGEHLIAMYSELYRYEAVVLRLFNVYGPRQSPTHPYANVTCKFAHAAARGLPIKLYGDGEQSRDFVYVDDVVDAFVRVGNTPTVRALYNVGTGSDVSILHLLRTAEQIGGRALEVERLPAWPNDIRCIRADISRLSADYGFAPSVALEEGLRRTVGWFQASSER